MLTIFFKMRITRPVDWHVGDGPLSECVGASSAEGVSFIEASGDELSAIYHEMDIPKVNASPVVRYPQPWASFIVMNLSAKNQKPET